MYEARVIEIFVASPGDLSADRKVIIEVVNNWNAENGRRFNCMFVARAWEFDLPQGGFDPLGAQNLIDENLLVNADACISLFWSTLGSNGRDGQPNSLHELRKVQTAGLPTYVWRKDSAIPVHQKSDRSAVDKFIAEAQEDGYLTGKFKTRANLSALIHRVLVDLASETAGGVVGQRSPAVLGPHFGVSFQTSGHIGYLSLQNLLPLAVEVTDIQFSSPGVSAPQGTSGSAPGVIAPKGTWKEMLYLLSPSEHLAVELEFSVEGGPAERETIEVNR